MKQTLSEIASLLLEIERGKPWQFELTEGGWAVPTVKSVSPITMLSIGCRIRLKPAEPDPHAEIKAAFERGEAVEMRCLNHALPKYRSWHCWADWEGVIQADWEYRLEPAEPDPHPNRKEVEEGLRKGKRYESRLKGTDDDWVPGTYEKPQWEPNLEYRLAPEPEWTKLGQQDVPPGSSIKHEEIEALVVRVGVSGVWIVGRTGTPYEVEFEELKDEWQINRSLPLTGKWDPNAWELCRKLKGGDNE